YRHPLALIMIDIDHFKRINDTLGHLIGDVVLKKLANLIVATVRETDSVCRYGGEELVVILPHTKIDDAVVAAESLRLEVENFKIILEDGERKGEVVQVTASFGVSAIVAEVESVHCLLGQADKALYFAKKEGRNKTASCAGFSNPKLC
ncbi:MAG: GGDEF domain-containing protein, partial [Desulfuromonadales bacterium]|nr:GGDEF domain-containing protein [Desulfuromonadales bacterium]